GSAERVHALHPSESQLSPSRTALGVSAPARHPGAGHLRTKRRRGTVVAIMRLLAGDVGGTKTLLRRVEADGSVSAEKRYESGAYPTFDALVRDFGATDVDAACFAVAG